MSFNVTLRDNGSSVFDLAITSTATQQISVSEVLSINSEALTVDVVSGLVNVGVNVLDTFAETSVPSLDLTMYLTEIVLTSEASLPDLSAGVSTLVADAANVVSSLIDPLFNLIILLSYTDSPTISLNANLVPGAYSLGAGVLSLVSEKLEVTADIYILAETSDAALDIFLPGISGTSPAQYIYPGPVNVLAELLSPGVLLLIVNDPIRISRLDNLLNDVEIELSNSPTIMLANRAKPNIA